MAKVKSMKKSERMIAERDRPPTNRIVTVELANRKQRKHEMKLASEARRLQRRKEGVTLDVI